MYGLCLIKDGWKDGLTERWKDGWKKGRTAGLKGGWNEEMTDELAYCHTRQDG